MADRQYTSKQRAKRIDLGYFKRPHPFRRTKLVLSVAATVVAGLWLLFHAVRGDHTIYTSGPVATAHAMFDSNCRVCHVPAHGGGPAIQAAGPVSTGGGFFLKVTDQACTSCHAGPIHHESQVSTPTCATCHIEHEGRTTLARIDDIRCTTCHADVALQPGAERRFEAKVPSFARHPEFAVDVRDGDKVRRVRLDQTDALKDTARINLNHQKHMRAGLKGLEDLQKLEKSPHIVETKDGLQLSCTYCHDTDPTRAMMQPVSYEKHCGPACHPLDFDGRFPQAETPHRETSLVHAYLRTLYLQAFEDCQAVRGEAPSAENEPQRKRCAELDLIPAAAVAPTAPADAPPARGGRLGRRGGGDATEAAPAPAPAPEAPADAPRGGRLGRRGAAEPPAEPPAPAQAEAPADEPRGRRLLRGGGEAAAEPPAQAQADAPADAPRGRRLLRGGEAPAETPAAPRAAAAPRGPGIEWVADQLRSTERLVYRQKCGFCHVMVTDAGPRPETAPTLIPVRWMPHATFNHGVHRVVTCTECHRQAEKSTETADVLLPSVKVCQDCHTERGGARTACVTCHLYHDKQRERPLDGPFTIRQLAGAPHGAATPPATQ